MATRGIDIRQAFDRIILRASLKDSSGAKVTSGTTEMRVYRLEDDGTLDVLDWDSGTKDFVSSGATDDEVTMTHRQADGVDTGIWTYAITDATILAAFSLGQVYIVQVTNSGASPESQEREFQFGGVEGDQVTPAAVWAYDSRTLTSVTIVSPSIPSTASKVELLQTMELNLLNEIATISPTMTYSVDGQSVDHNGYRQSLLNNLEQVQRLIAQTAGPFDVDMEYYA